MPKRIIVDDQLKCSQCGLWQELSNYRHGRSLCLKCRHLENNAYVNKSIDTYLNRALVVARHRAKLQTIPCTITTEEMIMQYESQGGKCFYSGVEMVWGYGKGRSHYSLSVDKIIPLNGYVMGNVVLCSLACNKAKSDLTINEIELFISKEWADKIRAYTGIR